MTEIHGFLLVTTDPLTLEDGTGSALSLIEARIEKNLWPIYARTRNRKQLKPGRHVAFYVAGDKSCSGNIVATAVIGSIEKWSAAKGSIDPDVYLTDSADQVLRLTDISFLERPIRLKDRVLRLSFAPKNMQRWGVFLMGGCRSLSREDWKVLLDDEADNSVNF